MRSHVFASLTVLALVSSVGLGCSSKSADPSAKEDVGGFPIPDAPSHAQPLTLDAYCDAKAKVSCHLDVPCCASAGIVQTEAQCLDAVRAKCLDEVAEQQAKGHVFVPKNAGICVLGAPALYDGCTLKSTKGATQSESLIVSDACKTIWNGTVAEGGTCAEAGDCATPDIPGATPVCAHSDISGVVRDTCKLWNTKGDGEPCADSFACARGTYCDGAGGPGTCRAPKVMKRGESCGVGVSCEAGSSCRDGVCGDGLGVGESCSSTKGGCDAAFYCAYDDALTAETCTAKKAIGAACRRGYDYCISGAQCGTGNTCLAIVALGAACTEDAQCAAESQKCLAGVCAPRNDVGTKATCTAVSPPPPEPALTATPAPSPRILSVDRATACVVTTGGAVTCWGQEFGSSTGSKPTAVAGVTGALEIAVGSGFACVRLEGGTVSCWGSGRSGELGQPAPDSCGSTPCANKPIAVPGITNAVKVVATSGRACALLADGTISCWGRHDGSSAKIIFTPTLLPGIQNAVDVAADLGSVMAVTSAGYVKRWSTLDAKPEWVVTTDGDYETNVVALGGAASYGPAALHADGTVSRAPAALGAASDVASGQNFTCAVVSDGTVQCYGTNTYGQLGTGEVSTHDAGFVSTVRGVKGAYEVAASSETACAATDTGVYCWGNNWYNLVSSTFGDTGPKKVF